MKAQSFLWAGGLSAALLGSTAAGALAAEVTSDQLLNAAKDTQNWLMNHRTYDGHRYSPLDVLTKDNVKDLKMAYAVAIGGAHGNEYLEATPLAEDGNLYLTDYWGVVYKIDGSNGKVGRIVWTADPGQEKAATNRGVALWGNLVVSAANSPARLEGINKDTGEILWETNVQGDQPNLQLTGAPLAIKDKIILGAAGGDSGSRDWISGFDAKTGKMLWQDYNIPAPGEPGSETWKGDNNAWKTGGGAMYVTGTYDPDLNLTYWGTGNPVPMFDNAYRPGDNLYTNSATARNPDTGEMKWYFQYTPGDMWDYDEEGVQLLVNTAINGQSQQILLHAGRNGFLYALDPTNGNFIAGNAYVDVNWTAGLDSKTGKPVDYDPNKDLQTYAGAATVTRGGGAKPVCPTIAGANNFWPPSFSDKTNLLYIPAMTGCVDLHVDTSKETPDKPGQGGAYVVSSRLESDMAAADPSTQKVVKREHLAYPNYSGAVTTGGGLVFTGLADGSLVALDDTSLQQLWSVNLGTGITAPPIVFGVGGKEYVAILTGPSGALKTKLAATPELSEMRNGTFLFVFGL